MVKNFKLTGKNKMKKQNTCTHYYSASIAILAAALAWCSTAQAEYNPSSYNFAPEVVELHIVKNDGMSGHGVYTCRNVRTCYNLFLTKWHKDKYINCATKMYIKRSNGNVMRLTGGRK